MAVRRVPILNLFILQWSEIKERITEGSDKPEVFGSLLPVILNSDHFRVSFETVLTARKWPFYERLFHKQ
jgi:hypothetical protein